MRSLPLLTAVALAACEPSPAPPRPPPPAPASAVAPQPLPLSAGTWGTFRSERFELQLQLPDGRAWRIDDHAGPWLSATHPPTESTLVARTWTEDGRVARQRCEERARLWRVFPDPARAEPLPSRTIDAPAGFDTFVSIGILPGKPGGPVLGFAVAFGGHGHRCFAWAYTTVVRGPGTEPVLAERLATMVERSLGRVVFDSELTRVRREPLEPGRSP